MNKTAYDRKEACRKRYNKLKEQGLCVKCGKAEPQQSKTLCLSCKKKHNERASRYYHINKKL